MSINFEVIVVGAGIFGVTAALELQQQGRKVALVDPGPLPNPLASSTDISKVVRIEYGTDETYAHMAEEAREGWLIWNELFPEPRYHEVGVVMLTSKPMESGEYEYENYQSLLRRGYAAVRLSRKDIATEYPAFDASQFSDGYFHAEAGYVESGRVVADLLALAEQAGVMLIPDQTVTRIQQKGGRVTGVSTRDNQTISGNEVVLAAGAWTPYLLPELRSYMRSVGMPVFHLRPENPEPFQTPRLVVFSTDVTRTGWYGFPLHPLEGVVKVANHGPGREVHPVLDERKVTAQETDLLRSFLARVMPGLANAPIVYTRRCLYCDTRDEHFWIDRHPEIRGLTVASGGSGHAFKFGPLIGKWVADALEGKPQEKFRWRHLSSETQGEEASRYREKPQV